jgi:hypothetical protein
VSGTPYTFLALCLDDNAHALAFVTSIQGISQLLTHFITQTVEMVGILHLHITDAIFDNSIY